MLIQANKQRQRCFFPGEAERRFSFITKVTRAHLKVVTSSGGSAICPQIKGIVSQSDRKSEIEAGVVGTTA